MKSILQVLLVGGWGLAANAADNPEDRIAATNVIRLTSTYLNQLTEQMRTNHPSLRAAAARVRAADAATNSVRSWDDPELIFGGTIADGARGPSLREDGDLLYGVEQRLPLFGKPQAARRIAQAEAEVAGARSDLQFQSLRRDLMKALFRAAYAERVLAVNHQDLTWIETLSATAEERYRSGNGSQIEVLRLQNERARRADTLRTEARRRDDLIVTVNRFLARDLNASLAKFELPEAAGAVAYTPRLVELAVRHDPRLRVMHREIETAEANVAGARKTRLPDVAGFADTRQYSGDGGFREATVGVKLSLPWFNRGRYQSDVARERARLEAAIADAADQEQAIREEVHRLTVNLDAARREALLYHDQILPRSEQALTVARENWLNNRGTFTEVMEARRLLLEAQLAESRAVADQYQLLAELVLCCGFGDFEMLQTLGITNDNPPALQPQR